MQNNDDAKQLIAERLHQSTNVLITVKNNPSVDELSAALALTLLLNKLDKHATAVFSGAMPPAMSFLEPNKTFEHTVDSLRDFIIALDKEKADRLRYKVENDVVKIFITPYRSVITDKDLQFSQGDFNVEVIVALGVENREDLDRAITAHGRILHDATVVTINNREEHSNLGVIDWKDSTASSICEMLTGLAEQLGPKLLDAQISTALLTGVVASTDRFSNKQTTPHAMTIAAELMADGANQQLIANNLRDAQAKLEQKAAPSGKIDKSLEVNAVTDTSQKIKKPDEAEKPTDGSKGEMKVRHDEAEKNPAEALAEPTAEAPIQTEVETTPKTEEAIPITTAEEEKPVGPTFEEMLKQQTASEPQPEPVTSEPAAEVATPTLKKTPPITPIGVHDEHSNERPNWQRLQPPSLGGTLNATTAEVEEEKRQQEQEEANHNHVTLEHHNGSSTSPFGKDVGMPTELPPAPTAVAPTIQPLSAQPAALPSRPPAPETASAPETPATPPAADAPSAPDAAADLEAARQAVSDALGSEPFNPAHQPEAAIGASPMPLDSTPSAPPAPPAENTPLATPVAPAPTQSALPPMPDFSTLPPLPPMPTAPDTTTGSQPNMPPNTSAMPPLPPTNQPPAPPAPGQVSSDPNDPNQFKIPGQ